MGLLLLLQTAKIGLAGPAIKDIKTFDQEKCAKILAAVQNRSAQVVEVNKAYKKTFPPQLYNLTELQRDANKLFSFSAKETLAIMQRLYENHKVLTYPRTDSRFISTDIVDTLKDRVRACGQGPYRPKTLLILKNPINANKSFVDNSKVSDHHAIIPTEEPVVLGALSDKERKIFDLVVKRFLAALYPPFEYEQTTIRAKIGEQFFIARGKIVLKQGWKEVYENNFEDDDGEEENDTLAEQTLPQLNKGDILKISSIKQTSGETSRPRPLMKGACWRPWKARPVCPAITRT